MASMVTIKRANGTVFKMKAKSFEATQDVYVIEDLNGVHYFEPKAGADLIIDQVNEPVDPNS
jgi:hypothetical protein